MSRFSFAPPPRFAALAFTATAFAFALSASAQDDFLPDGPPTDGTDNENLRMRGMPGTPGAFEIAFWSRLGRTYVPQRSTDLVAWESFPVIETGRDAAISYGFTSESPRVFVRLRILEATYTDPYALDFDGDGLTNQQEFDARTDPFSLDTDGDGLPDKWEVDHGLDPRDPADALTDPDGDGLSNLDEYREGTDPNLDFYQGVAPLLTVIDGADQARRPGEFLPRPMRVRVTRPDGLAWSGAPIRFTATADEGLLSLDTTGAHGLHPALTVRADDDGYAQVWLKCP